jgi:hypothetical protein
VTVAAIVVENLLYVAGAAVGILVGGLLVTLRHRRPTSVEANVVSFHRGLQALAPDRSGGPGLRQRRPAPAPPTSPARSVHVVGPSPPVARVAEPPAGAGGTTVTEAETV